MPAATIEPVPGRAPCPCGSGKRYKACHGRAARSVPFVARPFEGLAGEADWVALREVVPAATSTARLRDGLADVGIPDDAPREVTVVTVLPLAWPALRRKDGAMWLALQGIGGSGDASRDLAAALVATSTAEPGSPVRPPTTTPATPRLQDLLDPDTPFDVTVHDGFSFWVEDSGKLDEETSASLERANAAVVPTARLVSVPGAYWARISGKEHLRWVLTGDEEPLLDALARLYAADALGLGPGTRFIGTFRADGALVPVWDLAPGTMADDVEDPVVDLRARLDEALANTAPLTSEQRRARAGLSTRQLTLR